jgi:acetyl-CoA carboxylase alpha subunit
MMLQYAIYEVIAPEGAATILFRDARRAEQIASQLRLTASDCLKLGIADVIIPEPAAGIHTDPEPSMQALQRRMLDALAELEHMPVRRLLARRYRKFRSFGRFRSLPARSVVSAVRLLERAVAPQR